jgi:hypothetical protein
VARLSEQPVIHRPDVVNVVLEGRLWQSGCYVRRADLPARLDVVIAVGDAHGPRDDADDEEWWKAWGADLSRVEPGRPQRPIHIHAPLIDTHRAGMLDFTTAEAVARFGALMMRRGRKVLVHCDAGMFRSVLVAALVVHYFTGCSGPDALARVRRAQGRMGERALRIGPPEMDAMIAACKPFAVGAPDNQSTANEREHNTKSHGKR